MTAQPLDRRCPTCGANPGQRCAPLDPVTGLPDYGRSARTHRERRAQR